MDITPVPVRRRRVSVSVLQGLPGKSDRIHTVGFDPADTENIERTLPGQDLWCRRSYTKFMFE